MVLRRVGLYPEVPGALGGLGDPPPPDGRSFVDPGRMARSFRCAAGRTVPVEFTVAILLGSPAPPDRPNRH